MKFSIKYFFIIRDQIRRKLIYQVAASCSINNKKYLTSDIYLNYTLTSSYQATVTIT